MSDFTPKFNFEHAWNYGESGWNTGIDDMIRRLDVIIHMSVLDRSLATPPASPSHGDTYLVAPSGSGAWAGFSGLIAVYDSPSSSWMFVYPLVGMSAYVQGEDLVTTYTSSGWSYGTRIAGRFDRLLANLAVLDRDLTAPPGSPSDGDVYIVGSPATGAWAGWEGSVTVYESGGWHFHSPDIGLRAFIIDENVLSVYKTTGWSTGVAI